MDMESFAFIFLPLALCVVGLGVIAWARLWPVPVNRVESTHSETKADDLAVSRDEEAEAFPEYGSLFASQHQVRTHIRNVLKSAEMTAHGEYRLPKDPMPLAISDWREVRKVHFSKALVDKSIEERVRRRGFWPKDPMKKEGARSEALSR